MTQDQAAQRLLVLARRAEGLRSSFTFGNMLTEFSQMKFEAAGIVASRLGSNHYLTTKLNDLPVSQRAAMFTQVGDESVTDQFVGLVRAASNLVGATSAQAAPNPPICDPDLWENIEELVRIEAWAKIPADVATFVEDWYRKRGGVPRLLNGTKLSGSDLYNQVLKDHPLGDEESERQGWRFLGMGLTQAIGNLHRHNNIEHRPDAEQLAWRVIGLGSLLIGEMKLTHPHNPEPD